MADPRIAVVVDAGEEYGELRGVELRGRVEVVGEVPRTGEPVPELDAPEQAFADRYSGGTIVRDGRHAWLRLVPDKITSWDFRKIDAARRSMSRSGQNRSKEARATRNPWPVARLTQRTPVSWLSQTTPP